jgi:hypothetical protein
VFHEHMRQKVRQVVTVSFAGAAALGLGPAGAGIAGGSLPAPVPAVTDYQYLSASTTPPAETDCFSVGRRCFTPTSMQASYNPPSLYAANNAQRAAAPMTAMPWTSTSASVSQRRDTPTAAMAGYSRPQSWRHTWPSSRACAR